MFILASCTSMRMSYDAQVNNKKNNVRQVFHYEKSYDLGYLCPITGILYGGSCWLYSGYPNGEHITNMNNDAQNKLNELLGKNNWEISGFPVMVKKDWSNSGESFLLNGDIPLETKIEAIGSPQSETARTETATPPKYQFKNISNSNWQYSVTKDMDGIKTYYATSTSKNKANFRFPYNGGSTLSMTFIKGENSQASVYFAISKGQFDYSGEGTMRAKFGDIESSYYEIEKSISSSSNNIISVKDNFFGRFVGIHKKLLVQLSFYDHGYEEFKFDISGLQEFFYKD